MLEKKGNARMMNPKQIEMARHALGFPNKQNISYRNHFCIGPDGDGWDDWQDLVKQGLAVERKTALCGGDSLFHLTLKGALQVRENKEHLSPEDAKTMREMESL